MKKVKKVLLWLSLILFSGCTQPSFQSEESVYIIWKTPSFRYADQGFVYTSAEKMKIEIYGSGQALMRLEIGKRQICSSFLQCTDKKHFNALMLSRWYPESILEDIFKGKVIFRGKGMVKKRNGFTQTVKNGEKYQIQYSVLNNEIIFRDTINQILIKVTKQ